MLERSADFKTGVDHVHIERICHILHWGQSNMWSIYGCNKTFLDMISENHEQNFLGGAFSEGREGSA